MFQPKWYRLPAWNRKRNEVIAAAGAVCQGKGCSAREGLEVHHVNGYTNYREFITGPVEVLCKEHHRDRHSPGRPDRKRSRAAAMEV